LQIIGLKPLPTLSVIRLLAAQLSDSKGHPLSADKRRKWCDDEDNAAGLFFETDLVYTFHLWQDVSHLRIRVVMLMSSCIMPHTDVVEQPHKAGTGDST
jgi:hypothetical protein